jgi:hypothetical protein
MPADRTKSLCRSAAGHLPARESSLSRPGCPADRALSAGRRAFPHGKPSPGCPEAFSVRRVKCQMTGRGAAGSGFKCQTTGNAPAGRGGNLWKSAGVLPVGEPGVSRPDGPAGQGTRSQPSGWPSRPGKPRVSLPDGPAGQEVKCMATGSDPVDRGLKCRTTGSGPAGRRTRS